MEKPGKCFRLCSLEKYNHPTSYVSLNPFQTLYTEQEDIEDPPGLVDPVKILSKPKTLSKPKMQKVSRKKWIPLDILPGRDLALETDSEYPLYSNCLCRPFGLGYPEPEGILSASGFKSVGGRVDDGVSKKTVECAVNDISTSMVKDILNLEEVNELSNVESEDDEYLDMTVDSGASDTVANRQAASRCAVKPSEGSRNGVKYVAAAGKTIPNEGEKQVRVKTEEGHFCNLKIQITAVNKALLSVSKICDAGHEVVFTKFGGHIVHCETGQIIKFRRVDGVYRLRLKVVGASESGFTRPGM